jgi:hypothetical protein
LSEVTPFRRVKDIDEKLTEVQDAAASSFASIINKQILAGRLVTVPIPAGLAVMYPHGLGREIQGWVVVDKDADANVYRTNKNNPKLFLNLTATAQVTLKLWVF